MKFEIKNRFDGELIVAVDIECGEDTSYSFRLGLAVKVAVDKKINLRGAYLSDAYLSDAYLSDAYLSDADLRNADLRGAYLRDADLRDADLRCADLRGANLSDADLSDADLRGAYLSGAYLSDGFFIYDYKFYRPPIQIFERYNINIWDGYMEIGCEKHLIKDWIDFSDKKISKMDFGALEWWNIWKDNLINIAKSTGRMELPMQKDFSYAKI